MKKLSKIYTKEYYVIHARPVVGDHETPCENIICMHMTSTFLQIHIFVAYIDMIQA